MLEFKDTYEFEWDSGNDLKNWSKHSLTQKEIEEAFIGFKLIFPDEKHSQKEPRFGLIGKAANVKLIFVAYTLRQVKVRVISARSANLLERHIYEKASKKYSKI